MSSDSVVRLDAIGAEVRIGVHLDVGGRRETPPDEGHPHAGQVVGGRYELVRVIGRGSMGAVWLAHHRALDEQVALKLLAATDETRGVEGASTAASRFRFEAQVAARLSRKTRHIVRVTDYGQEGLVPYLVMELLEGQTLEARLLKHGPLEAADVAKLVTQIASGLEIAHADGVLHRDLKPANVFLVGSDSGEPLVKLVDFGIARRSASHGPGARFATERGVVVGTPGYMGPEQAGGSSELDERADLWSLAAIAYEALTCELPVDGTDVEEMLANLRAGRTVPLRERRPELPVALERFFERAFARRIEDRHTTCAELALAFESAARFGAKVPVTQRIPWLPGTKGRPVARAIHRPRPRRRGRAAISLASAFVVAAAVLFGAWRASADRSAEGAHARADSSFADSLGAAGSFAAVRSTTSAQDSVSGATETGTTRVAESTRGDERQTTETTKRPRAPSEKAPPQQAYDYGEFKTYF